MIVAHRFHRPRRLGAHFALTALVVVLWTFAAPSRADKPMGIIDAREWNALSKKAFADFKKQHAMVESGPLFERAQCLLRDLAAHVERVPEGTAWEIVIANDPRADASSLPGGQLILYSGIESIAQDRDELAYVIATLIAQVSLEQAKRKTEDMRRQSTAALIGQMLGQQPPPEAPPSDETARFLASDRTAMVLMTRAGYDSDAAIRTLDRTRTVRGPHASYDQRLAQARTLASDASQTHRTPQCE